MEFLAPIMLVGLAGAAVPIAIHLIGRRRARVVRFAAMDFLLGSDRKVARYLRLREILLLIARVLAIVAIPLALAKPFTSCAADGPVVERGPQAAAIVIDNSLASSYELGGRRLLDRARDRAKTALDQMGPEAEVVVLTAAEGAGAPEELTLDHVALRRAIDSVEMVPRPLDATTALRRAAELLQGSEQPRRHVYLLTTGPARALALRELPWDPATGPALTVIDVSDGAALDNAAVVDLQVRPDPAAGSRGVRVTAEIANFGARAVDDRAIELRIDGQVVARGAVSLVPGERRTKELTASLPEGARFADVVVELAPDALPLDDRRYVRAELRERVRALLVNGDPRTVRHEDELFYLEAALRPGDRDESGVTFETTTVDELARAELDDYDVIVLANARALPAAMVARLDAWVRTGGGLWITTGDNVEADAYNATMRPLLPQELRDPVEVAYGATGDERRGRALRLAKLERDHPVFAVFAEDARGLREARFDTVTFLGPTTRTEDRRVLARFSNGGAALVEARSGEGRLLLYTSSIDRAWNDLAIHPGFLPLTQRATRYLARKQDDRRAAQVVVGRRHTLAVTADLERIEVAAPDGSTVVIEGERVRGKSRVGYGDTNLPGIYTVLVTPEDGKPRALPEAAFAVNLAADASDLRAIAADAPPDAVARIAEPADDRGHRRRVELWHAIAAALLGLLLVESLLLLRA